MSYSWNPTAFSDWLLSLSNMLATETGRRSVGSGGGKNEQVEHRGFLGW